jgi:hypothetical protein
MAVGQVGFKDQKKVCDFCYCVQVMLLALTSTVVMKLLSC